LALRSATEFSGTVAQIDLLVPAPALAVAAILIEAAAAQLYLQQRVM
jgi:hypothetical protein